MTQRLIIEGDLVTVVEEQVLSRARLADVLPLIENRPPITLLHPRTAIFTYWNEQNPQAKTAKFLCELPPGIRSIVKLGRRYRLAMPWTYFIFSFRTSGNVTSGGNWSMEDHRVFHAPERVNDYQSRLWSAFLPNVYDNANICFGSTGVPTDQSLQNRVDQLVNEWYLTEFNNDVIGGRSHPLPFNAAFPTPGFRPWVDATAEHGAAAWRDFPEWNAAPGTIASWTVAEALQQPDMTRTLPTITERIPELTMPATFGRTEQWLRESLTPLQRGRLRIAMQNVAQDEPETFAEPTPINPEQDEDGGEPV